MSKDDNERSENELESSTDDSQVESTMPNTVTDEPADNGHETDHVFHLSLCDRHEVLKECEALIIHVARHGDILSEDGGLKEAYKQLLHLVGRCDGRVPSSRDWPDLLDAYANVTFFTYRARGVNGRSVLDTWGVHNQKSQKWWNIHRWLFLLFNPKRYQRSFTVAIWLSVFAFLLQIFTGWAGRIGDPDTLSVASRLLYYVVDDMLPLLVPAVCGGIGSCVFLMKLLSDKLSAFAYEEARLKGDGTRIFLGAILGVVVVLLFFPTFSEKVVLGEATFGPVAAAFVAGFGVKPIYSAFERVVEGVAGLVSGRGRLEG